MEIKVRFAEKDATVRYLPSKVTLGEIIKRYESTPFGASLAGHVVTIAKSGPVTLRSWSTRTKPKGDDKGDAPKPIEFFVETVVDPAAKFSVDSEYSFTDLNTQKLAAAGNFEKSKVTTKPTTKQLVVDLASAKVFETVMLKPGDSLVSINYKITTKDTSDKPNQTDGKLGVVVRTPRPKVAAHNKSIKNVTLIGGKLDLKLGHLCDQRGCVDHFFNSLTTIESIVGVEPRPSMEHPSATLFLPPAQAVDLWTLRETLRAQSIEVTGLVPRDLGDYQIQVELARWKSDDSALPVEQCLGCRDATVEALKDLPFVVEPKIVGSNVRCTLKRENTDLISILDQVARAGVAPRAVWLVPDGVVVLKTSPPLERKPNVEPKAGVSQSHPTVEFHLNHKCDAGPAALSFVGQPSWASSTDLPTGKIARATIADRKHAALSPILSEFRAAGTIPQEVRLNDFGDVRIMLEFAHICGDIVYSKPPKPKKKPADEKDKDKKTEPKPFVPKALHPATTSNGRKAIQTAIENVSWIKNARFFDYHSKFDFRGGPTKVMIAFQPKADEAVRLDDMINALRSAGFPPKSISVSRRFSGIPFTQPLPDKLLLTDRDGRQRPLSELKQTDRPLALAFVSLKCKRHKKYEADPKFYKHLGETIEKYKDRVDFVTIAANPDDKFEEVAAFLEKTTLPAPLHDAKGTIRAALNVQETPAPHFYIFDGDGLFRHAGDPHDKWDKPDDEERDNYLVQALDIVLSGKYEENGAAFFNKSLCNCSHPKCKCPKCGCGPSCRCGIKH